MDGSLLKIFSFQWIFAWSLFACYQFTVTSLEGHLPDLKLLTPAQAANAVALRNAMLWFSTAGASPAMLAMLLKGRGWIRRALASAFAKHCVINWILGVALVVTARPEDNFHLLSVISAMSFILFAVVDVISALGLLCRPDGEEE